MLRDEGIVSLADYVDEAGPDGVAITVETDDRGSIHPAVYVRRRGRVDADAVLDEGPLTEYRTASIGVSCERCSATSSARVLGGGRSARTDAPCS